MIDGVIQLLWARLEVLNIMSPVVLCGLGLALAFAYRAWRSRLHGKEFRIERQAEGFSIHTAQVRAIFSSQTRMVAFDYSSRKGVFANYTVSFDDLAFLRLEENIRDALGEELLFEDIGLFDIWFDRRFADQMCSRAIILRTKDGKNIPLLLTHEYRVRDFLDFITPLMLEILTWTHLYEPVEFYVEERFKELEAFFVEFGIPYRESHGYAL